MQQKIIILDFGSQTTQLIGRRVRELDTFCEILPYKKFPKDDTGVIVTNARFDQVSYPEYLPMSRHHRQDTLQRHQSAESLCAQQRW